MQIAMNALAMTVETVGAPTAAALTSVGPKMANSVLAALADGFSKRIIISAIERERTVEEMSAVDRIPLSTCYRRVRGLVDAGLVLVERIVITGSGKRYATYRSCFKSFRISFDARGLSVQGEVNEAVAEKVRYRWLTNREAELPVEVT